MKARYKYFLSRLIKVYIPINILTDMDVGILLVLFYSKFQAYSELIKPQL